MNKKKNNSEKLKELIQEVVSDNLDQGRAMKAIFREESHIFITGKAGSGKTTFMRKILDHMNDVAVVAPTGIAAINAGGVTIHSFFHLPFDPYIPIICEHGLKSQLNVNGNGDFRKTLKKIKTIIIDEVSMVRADLLDKVSDVLQNVRKNDKPFGGVRLIMFGDLNQLPPVITSKEENMYYNNYDSPYFFSSVALKSAGFTMIEFSKIYRQSDPVFVDLLNNIRKGKMTEEDIALLNSRYTQIPEGFEAIRAVSHNYIAQQVNQSMLDRLPGKLYTFNARISGVPPKESGCEDILSIKIGCQVVMTVNSKGEYVNGSLAIIHDICPEENEIYVKVIDSGKVFSVSPAIWENKKYEFTSEGLSSNVIGTIMQFPMKLGYSLSIHKVQGMTFDRVIVDAGRSFTNGQVYVALSRCKTLENTYLTSPISNDQLIQDERLIEFYRKSDELGGVFPPEKYEPFKEDTDIFEEFGL